MSRMASTLKFILISTLSILLSLLTMVMGAPLIKVIRKAFGPLVFWTFGVVVVGLFWLAKIPSVSVLIGSLWMTLGAYYEMETRGWSIAKSSIWAIAAGAGTLFATGFYELSKTGSSFESEFAKVAAELAKKIQQVNPAVVIDPAELAQQIPSAIIVMLVLSLGMALIFEKKVFTWFNLPAEKADFRVNLLEFKVPDFILWITMVSALLTMVNGGRKELAVIGMNILNVAIVLYFFQGLAILEVLLRRLRAGVLTRVLSYFIFVGQLTVVLSVVGFIDFWVDFRRRFQNWKTAEGN